MLNKYLFTLMVLFFVQYSFAQETDQNTTDQFIITGKVKQEKTINITDIKRLSSITLSDVNVSCSPKIENRVKEIKGVLLKNILDSVAFQYEKSRMLNQYYFLFVAKDGYKMVFSFNEMYNTEIGKNLYLVTEIEGKSLDQMDNRIMVLTTKDIRGGSRNMKWLSKIVVGMAE